MTRGALAELNGFVHEFHVTNNPCYFKTAPLEEVTAWFRRLLADPTVRIWVAEEAGLPVGYVYVCLHDRPANLLCHARRWFEIGEIGVRPGRQRSGIGRALVEQVMAAALEQGIEDVELASWSFNSDAQEAFRRLGFVPNMIRFGQKISRAEG